MPILPPAIPGRSARIHSRNKTNITIKNKKRIENNEFLGEDGKVEIYPWLYTSLHRIKPVLSSFM
jgi:hypothetical protein